MKTNRNGQIFSYFLRVNNYPFYPIHLKILIWHKREIIKTNWGKMELITIISFWIFFPSHPVILILHDGNKETYQQNLIAQYAILYGHAVKDVQILMRILYAVESHAFADCSLVFSLLFRSSKKQHGLHRKCLLHIWRASQSIWTRQDGRAAATCKVYHHRMLHIRHLIRAAYGRD